MSKIVWEEPPSETGKASKYDDLAEALFMRPNVWALAGTFATYSAVTRLRALLGPKYEIRGSRNEQDGQVHVWARFTG